MLMMLQDAAIQDEHADRRMSFSHASSSTVPAASSLNSGHGSGPQAGVLPPRAPEHQSRSKRLATKMLKKLGTKERFRHPQPEQPGTGMLIIFISHQADTNHSQQ